MTGTLEWAERARGDAGRQGWYEVYYVTAALGGGRALWARYTLLCPSEGPARAALWGIASDRGGRGRLAARVDLAGAAWQPAPGGGVDLGIGSVGPDGCHGLVRDSAGRALRWELRWRRLAGPVSYFPRLAERAAGGATFPIAAIPAARAGGIVEVDGERIEVADAAVEQSHLFGGRHASRWGWAHALDLDGDPHGFLTLVWARPRRLGGRVPAVSALVLGLDGAVHRSRGLRAVRWHDRGGELIGFAGRAGDARVEGSVRVPQSTLVGLTYHDPDGSAVHCAHSTVADLEASVRVGGAGARVLRSLGACAVERGGRRPWPHVWEPL